MTGSDADKATAAAEWGYLQELRTALDRSFAAVEHNRALVDSGTIEPSMALTLRGDYTTHIMSLIQPYIEQRVSDVEVGVIDMVRDAIVADRITMPSPDEYGNDWRNVTLRLNNIYAIPILRDYIDTLNPKGDTNE